jgi:hypothetical protein
MLAAFRIPGPVTALLGFLIFSGPVPLEAQPGGPFRAAYQFSFGTGYSAGVDLPARSVVNLGPGRIPLGINDAMEVLLRNAEGALILWRDGQSITLRPARTPWRDARLNERGEVCLVERVAGEEPDRLLFYPDPARAPESVAWGPNPSRSYNRVHLAAFNNRGTVILSTESESIPAFPPPSDVVHETFRLDIGSGSRSLLASFTSATSADYASREEGSTWQVFDLDNHGRSVGRFSTWSASSGPYFEGWELHFESTYSAIDRFEALPFEGLAINDAGVVLGRTEGPVCSPMILDAHGLRTIGPPLAALATGRPLMSGPSDGLEEIVMGNHYWKRMTEKDFIGLPTGVPAPDFWNGRLDDLVGSSDGWSDLRATAISANGCIAGTGLRSGPDGGEGRRHGFLLVPRLLVPDWDRDGAITRADHALGLQGRPWRIWVNDDDDSGELSREALDDLPESELPDHANNRIDGLRDVVDFFPLHLDLRGLLGNRLGAGDLSVTLSQADEAVQLVYTSLDPEQISRMHQEPCPDGFGPDGSSPLDSAPVHPVTAAGTRLDSRFVEAALGPQGGIVLFEGVRPSTAPLVLELRKSGKLLSRSSLPLHVGKVKHMFRILNLRQADPKFALAREGPWPTRMGTPPDLPDSYLEGFPVPSSTLLHVHGFNWGESELPAAHSEVFKRLYQTGLTARFVGVSWYSDQGHVDWLGTAFDYNENVINAFLSAAYLKSAFPTWTGSPASIFAHSLGTLLASSAIIDHGLDIARLLMVNAAIPAEAFSGEMPDRRLMVHPDWKGLTGSLPDYPEHLLAANWHRLFPDRDHRRGLSWKNRFAGITRLTDCRNFYSPAEDILRPSSGDLPSLLGDIRKRELIWAYNEMNKGTGTLASALTADIQGGWGFNRDWMNWVDPNGAARPPTGRWQVRAPRQATGIPASQLISHPFFRPFSSGDSDFPAWGDGQWLYGDAREANAHLPPVPLGNPPVEMLLNHAKILAEAIPAHSAAAGAVPLPNLPAGGNHNLDGDFRNPRLWPVREALSRRDRWLHSDYLNTALAHAFRLFSTSNQILKP